MSKLIVQESLDKDSDTYKALKAMGHLIYLIDTSYEDESHLTTIDNIIAYKNKLKAKAKAKDEAGNESGAGNGDEAEIERVPTPSLGVGVNTKYYKDIMELKRLNFHDDLSVYVCTYARHNGLDISADDISLSEIKRLSSDEDKDAFIGYNKEIRAAVTLKEILNSELLQSKRTNVPIEYRVRDGIDVSDDIDKIDDAQLMWAALQAWHLINGVNHKSAYANFIRHKIEEQYRYELRFRILSAKTEADGTRLVTILNNYANTNTVINGTFQEYLFSHIDFKELSLIEVMILRIYGIKTQSKYKKLIDRTGWMETYNKALDGDTVSLVQLERIDRKHLDDYRKKLISSRAFRAARINQYQDMQPSLLLKKAKSFLGDDKILQGELEKALSDGKISSESLIKAAFPDFLHKNIDYLLNLSTDEFMIEIDNGPSNRTTNFGNVYNAATSPASCVSLVLGNILSIKGIDPEVYTKASMIEEVISKK